MLALRTPTLPPAAHTNVYLVGPDEGPWVAVDPGSPYPDQQAVLDRALAEVGLALVLLTHHHGDHSGGAAALAARFGAPIAAHPNTAKRLPRLAISRLLEDGERVADLECVFTPGHADGHLCFTRDGYTIAGDMVAGLGTILIDPSEGDMTVYLHSLERLLARPQTMLLPAHGPALPDGHAKLREYIAHRLMREARVVAALDSSETPVGELVARAYADTPRVLWPLAERSLVAHLHKLAADGRAREVAPGRWSAT
ncbi:MAG TPA: MBL fold metallo-hydrolase [Kofleriaceae bacterium]|nr:MBL fold metallo-hydrolase [Kofleriaceae bacterium]